MSDINLTAILFLSAEVCDCLSTMPGISHIRSGSSVLLQGGVGTVDVSDTVAGLASTSCFCDFSLSQRDKVGPFEPAPSFTLKSFMHWVTSQSFEFISLEQDFAGLSVPHRLEFSETFKTVDWRGSECPSDDPFRTVLNTLDFAVVRLACR